VIGCIAAVIGITNREIQKTQDNKITNREIQKRQGKRKNLKRDSKNRKQNSGI
jgi:hypothetical protein